MHFIHPFFFRFNTHNFLSTLFLSFFTTLSQKNVQKGAPARAFHPSIPQFLGGKGSGASLASPPVAGSQWEDIPSPHWCCICWIHLPWWELLPALPKFGWKKSWESSGSGKHLRGITELSKCPRVSRVQCGSDGWKENKF